MDLSEAQTLRGELLTLLSRLELSATDLINEKMVSAFWHNHRALDILNEIMEKLHKQHPESL